MKGLIIDTNLLLLYFVGCYSPNLIYTCKFTHEYTEDDFKKIKFLVEYFRNIYITPQILAEISNISKKERSCSWFQNYLDLLIKIIKGINEEHIKVKQLLNQPALLKIIGFTDLSLIQLAKKYKLAIITNDRPFYVEARKEQCQITYFTDLQGKEWFSNFQVMNYPMH